MLMEGWRQSYRGRHCENSAYLINRGEYIRV